MGGVFTITAKAKKENEYLNVQETMIGLLGYDKENPPPSDLRLYSIYRYVIDDNQEKYLGYMIPVGKGGEIGYKLLIITLDGKFQALHDVDITPEKATERRERKTALSAVLEPPKTFVYGDETVIVRMGGKRFAYLLPGEFQGFKTFINVMLALDPSFEILGLEIMEHEEDPGLGGEIEQDYFKNQFKNKTFEMVEELTVIKEPLPDEYRRILEQTHREKGVFSEEEIARIRSKYQDQDIYALTGATISSKAVTDGVKGMIKRFAYRIEVLDRVIARQHVTAAF
jgi:electron transport complex protein RnfG